MKKIFFVLICVILLGGTILINGSNSNLLFENGMKVNQSAEFATDFSEVRKVKYFDSFHTNGPIDVYYVRADKRKVVVEGNEECVKNTITCIDDETLIIKLQKGKYNKLVPRVIVYAPDIEEMETNGSGNIVAKNVTSKELSLTTRGSGNITIDNITLCKELDVETLGSGNVYIKSAKVSDEIELFTAGSGNININGSCYKVETKALGSGSITGNLKYSKIERKTGGSGKISFVSRK